MAKPVYCFSLKSACSIQFRGHRLVDDSEMFGYISNKKVLLSVENRGENPHPGGARRYTQNGSTVRSAPFNPHAKFPGCEGSSSIRSGRGIEKEKPNPHKPNTHTHNTGQDSHERLKKAVYTGKNWPLKGSNTDDAVKDLRECLPFFSPFGSFDIGIVVRFD